MVFKEISTTDEFREIILNTDYELVVAYFTAAWCGPCKKIYPYVKNIGDNNEHIQAVKIDVDVCEELAQEYEIEAMPTFKFFKNKSFVQIDSFSGADSNRLVSTIKKNLEEQTEKPPVQEQTINLENKSILNSSEYLQTISQDPVNTLLNNPSSSGAGNSNEITGFSNFSNMDNFSNF